MLKTIKIIKSITIDTDTNQVISCNEVTEIINIENVKDKVNKTDRILPCSILLENNKIVISKDALELLNAVPGDRVNINYINEGNRFIPVIGKSSILGDNENGNVITKSSTFSFKGKKADTLLEYGNEFNLELYTDGIFKLISLTPSPVEIITDEELAPLSIIEGEDSDPRLIIQEDSNVISFDFNLNSL